MTDVAIGVTGRAELQVTRNETAEALGSGLVPVFATPALVALMEQAAVSAVAGSLDEGETTVGTKLDIVHLAATPVGDRVRAEAVVTGREGRRLFFTVTAWDSTEKIGEGRHERAVVSRERFLAGVRRKGLQAP